MKHDFKDKKVLVTGAAQGIGLGIATHFAKAGANTIIIDKDAEAGDEALKTIKAQGLKVEFYQCDVAEEQEIKSVFTKISAKYEVLDVLVNNAGIADPFVGSLEELDVAQLDKILAVNLRGPLLCCKYAMSLLKKSENSAILNISSTRAYMSEPNTFPYSASKGGLEALTHSLAISLQEENVRVNAIAPGWIEVGNWQKKNNRYEPKHSKADKEQHPVGRVGTPEDIAEAALFLCSVEAGFITGQNLIIDGGMTKKMIYV